MSRRIADVLLVVIGLGALMIGPTPMPPARMLRGLADDLSAMTATDLLRERGNVDVVRFQMSEEQFRSNAFDPTIRAYHSNGVKLIVTMFNDEIRTPADRRAFTAYARDLVTRYPWLTAVEIVNEANYHYSPSEYLPILADAYKAIKAVAPNVNVMHSNLDHADFSESDAFFAAGSTVYCDAVGVHLYKFLGAFDADQPARGGVRPLSTQLFRWMQAYQAKYGPIIPLSGTGKQMWATEVGIQWKTAAAIPTATNGGVGKVPPGTYYYLLGGKNRAGEPTEASAQRQTRAIRLTSSSSVVLTWPASSNDDIGIASYDIWRLASNNPRDGWQAYAGSGAPYDYRIPNGQYGYVGNVVNTGRAMTYTDNADVANRPYPGYDPPPGFDETWVTEQLPKILSESAKAGLTGVAWYTGRSSYANPDRGVFDQNYEDLSRMVHHDGTATAIWNAFVRSYRKSRG